MKKYIGLIIGLLPLIACLFSRQASAQLVMTGSYYVVLSGGTQASPTSLVLTNSASTGITNKGTGWIISENEFNQVKWNIGTHTGTYIVPFGYGTTEYLPLTCDITTAGVGNGAVKFSTYHCSTWENSLYAPSDVTSFGDYGAADYSNNMVDRFWEVDANTGYTTKPTVSLTFSYISGGGSSEVAAPNYIVNDALIAQRFNSTGSEWDDFTGTTGTEATSGDVSTVSSGSVDPGDLFRSWTVANDSALVLAVPTINHQSLIIAFPNPCTGSFTLTGVTPGQMIQLYNDIGQMLSSTRAGNATTMHFDLSTRANGVYLIRIQNTDGSLVTEQKIVKTQ